MLITTAHFMTDVMVTVDQVLTQFVHTGFVRLVENNSGVITLAMTWYVMLFGIKAIYHRTSLELSNIVMHFLLLLTIYSLLMHWELYDLFFYNIFTNEPGYLMHSLVSKTGNSAAPASAIETLDTLFSAGLQVATALFHRASFSNGIFLVYGLLVIGMTAASCLYAVALFIYAKIALAVLLLLGPLFLLCLLWPTTRGFFERWLQALVNYALIPLITCGYLCLTLSITQATLPGVTTILTEANAGVSGIWPYLGMCFITALLLMQVRSTCAALSGGLSLEAMGQLIPLVQKGWRATGMTMVSKKLIHHLKHYPKVR